MPLWTIYHPADAFSDDDKQKIAAQVTDIYAPFMPRFYVGIVFNAVAPTDFFIGGEPRDNFVRLVLEHIAREFPDTRAGQRFIDKVNQVIAPFIKDRGLDWEIHIDETPFDLWSINGFYPPRQGTPDEERWITENRASPRTHP